MALLSAFNPHELSEATVRAVATGREASLKEILDAIRGNLGAPTIQHLIVSGPRGYGKSFLMRQIQLEVAGIAREEGLKLVAILMPEELPHVKEPETLIRELTRALTGGGAEEAELTWHEDDGAAWEAAVEALAAAIQDTLGATGLIVALVENFDLLLRRAFPKEVQASRLRSLLTESGCRMMLIAASASGAIDRDYDDRLYQAFKEVPLGPWSVEDCLAFFDRQRADAGKPPLDDSARARAKAVAHFIGGTPRLATLLGDALFDEDVLRAADLLHRLVDELTPYYKERIEALPGRAQKLLDALLRSGEPATQSKLAERVKANSQSAIAGPFHDLIRERIVVGEKAPDSAEVLYRVADRVFAQYYRRRIIAHGDGSCALEGLVDLLAEFFSPQEKQAKAAELARLGRNEEARVLARLHDADRGGGRAGRRWILSGLAEYYIPRRLLPLASQSPQDVLRAIAELVTKGEVDRAHTLVESALASTDHPGDRTLLLLVRSRLNTYEGIEGGLAAADEAVAAAETSGDLGLVLLAGLGRCWSLSWVVGREAEALDPARKLEHQAASAGLVGDQAIALRYAALSLGRLDRHAEAVATARQAAELAHQAGDPHEEAIALRYAAFSLGVLDRHEEAVATARQAAELAHQAADLREEANALRHAAFNLMALGRQEEAVATARQAAELAHQAGDPREEAIALRLAAFSLGVLGRHEEAVNAMAASAGILSQSPDDEVRRYLVRSAAPIGGRAASWLGHHAEDLDRLHGLLRGVADNLNFEGVGHDCQAAWIRGLAQAALWALDDPDRLNRWGEAIDLHFPERFSDETDRMRHAAQYHRSGRDPATLARVDPDLTETLQVMFPPAKESETRTPPAKKRRRRQAG